jgi:hypothetical protein
MTNKHASETIEIETIRSALSKVDREAANHGADYASGMRNARLILEQELLGEDGV